MIIDSDTEWSNYVTLTLNTDDYIYMKSIESGFPAGSGSYHIHGNMSVSIKSQVNTKNIKINAIQMIR